MRSISSRCGGGAGLVDRYVGTAYDDVRQIAARLPLLDQLAGAVEDAADRTEQARADVLLAIQTLRDTIGVAQTIDANSGGRMILEPRLYSLPSDVVLPAGSVVEAGTATFDNGDVLGAPVLLDVVRGSWTPELRTGPHSAGVAYSSRDGRVHATGDYGFIQCTITLASKPNSQQPITIAGLPQNVVPASRWPIACQLSNVSGFRKGPLLAVLEGGVISLRRGMSRQDPPLVAADILPVFSITLNVSFPRF